jgi:transposase
VHDLAEVFDGVPSKHDAKDAAIIGKLHLEGRSERWPLRSGTERDAVAAVKLMGYYEELLQRGKGQLEAMLARHFPELDGLLEAGSATQLGLLAAYGSAQAVAADAQGAAALMRKLGGARLSQEKIASVLEAARMSTGIEPTALERLLMMELCSEMERARQKEGTARERVHELLAEEPAVRQMAAAVGQTTAAVLYAELGDPRSYEKPAQYIKSLGLNLKEHSSGKRKGAASITKRGSATARQYLYLAALRKVKDCPPVRAWFERKRARDGGAGKGGKGIVAIMRKLAAALWHVARGAAFDVQKLYNVPALGL